MVVRDANLENLTVGELKDRLKTMLLPATGNKEDLVERLLNAEEERHAEKIAKDASSADHAQASAEAGVPDHQLPADETAQNGKTDNAEGQMPNEIKKFEIEEADFAQSDAEGSGRHAVSGVTAMGQSTEVDGARTQAASVDANGGDKGLSQDLSKEKTTEIPSCGHEMEDENSRFHGKEALDMSLDEYMEYHRIQRSDGRGKAWGVNTKNRKEFPGKQTKTGQNWWSQEAEAGGSWQKSDNAWSKNTQGGRGGGWRSGGGNAAGVPGSNGGAFGGGNAGGGNNDRGSTYGWNSRRTGNAGTGNQWAGWGRENNWNKNEKDNNWSNNAWSDWKQEGSSWGPPRSAPYTYEVVTPAQRGLPDSRVVSYSGKSPYEIEYRRPWPDHGRMPIRGETYGFPKNNEGRNESGRNDWSTRRLGLADPYERVAPRRKEPSTGRLLSREDETERAIVVKGLSGLRVDSRDLKGAFSGVGRVEDAVVRSNTARVVFQTKYCAQEAVRRFHGGQLNDHSIEVVLESEARRLTSRKRARSMSDVRERYATSKRMRSESHRPARRASSRRR